MERTRSRSTSAGAVSARRTAMSARCQECSALFSRRLPSRSRVRRRTDLSRSASRTKRGRRGGGSGAGVGRAAAAARERGAPQDGVERGALQEEGGAAREDVGVVSPRGVGGGGIGH